MATTLDHAREAIKRFSTQFTIKRTEYRARMGNGSGVVQGTREKTVWVRVGNNPPFEVKNLNVPLTDNLPVIVGYANESANAMEVLAPDREMLENWQENGDVMHEPHAYTHQADAIGQLYADVVYVYKRALVPALAIPTVPPGMTLYVYPDLFPHAGTWKYWPGGYSPDFTAYRPSTDGLARLVTLYLDLITLTLGLVAGPDFDAVFTPEDMARYAGTPPDFCVPIVAALVEPDTSTLEEGNLLDLRILSAGFGNEVTFDATIPSTVDAAVLTSVAGTSAYPAHVDHVHGANLYDNTVPADVGTSGATGSSNYAARVDHVHKGDAGGLDRLARMEDAFDLMMTKHMVSGG